MPQFGVLGFGSLGSTLCCREADRTAESFGLLDEDALRVSPLLFCSHRIAWRPTAVKLETHLCGFENVTGASADIDVGSKWVKIQF